MILTNDQDKLECNVHNQLIKILPFNELWGTCVIHSLLGSIDVKDKVECECLILPNGDLRFTWRNTCADSAHFNTLTSKLRPDSAIKSTGVFNLFLMGDSNENIVQIQNIKIRQAQESRHVLYHVRKEFVMGTPWKIEIQDDNFHTYTNSTLERNDGLLYIKAIDCRKSWAAIGKVQLVGTYFGREGNKEDRLIWVRLKL